MNKIKISLILAGAILLITACSSSKTPPLKQVHYLLTQESGQQYYYCEICDKPTELSVQIYKPLEPDSPIESVPVIVNPIVKNNHLERKTKHHKKIRHRLKKINHKSIKQCIQWRTISNEKE